MADDFYQQLAKKDDMDSPNPGVGDVEEKPTMTPAETAPAEGQPDVLSGEQPVVPGPTLDGSSVGPQPRDVIPGAEPVVPSGMVMQPGRVKEETVNEIPVEVPGTTSPAEAEAETGEKPHIVMHNNIVADVTEAGQETGEPEAISTATDPSARKAIGMLEKSAEHEAVRKGVTDPYAEAVRSATDVEGVAAVERKMAV